MIHQKPERGLRDAGVVPLAKPKVSRRAPTSGWSRTPERSDPGTKGWQRLPAPVNVPRRGLYACLRVALHSFRWPFPSVVRVYTG